MELVGTDTRQRSEAAHQGMSLSFDHVSIYWLDLVEYVSFLDFLLDISRNWTMERALHAKTQAHRKIDGFLSFIDGRLRSSFSGPLLKHWHSIQQDRSPSFRIDVAGQLGPQLNKWSWSKLLISCLCNRSPADEDLCFEFNITPILPRNHFIESAETLTDGINFLRHLSSRRKGPPLVTLKRKRKQWLMRLPCTIQRPRNPFEMGHWAQWKTIQRNQDDGIQMN